MTLEKAKEILNLNLKEAGRKMPADCRDALKLMIEAAIFVEQWRQGHYFTASYLLPGETKA